MADQESNGAEFADTQTRKTIKLKLPTQNPVAKMNLEKTDTQMVDPLSSRDTDTGNLDILNNTQTRKTIKLKPMSPRNIDVNPSQNDGNNTNSRKVVVIKPNPAKPTISQTPNVAPPSAPTIKLDATAPTEEVSDETIAVAKIAPPKAATAFKPPAKPTIPLSSSSATKAPAPAPAPVPESPVAELSEDDTIAVAKIAPPKPAITKPQFAKPTTVAPTPVANEEEASAEDDRTVKIAKPKKTTPPVADNVVNEEDKATVKLKKRPPTAPPSIAKPVAPPSAVKPPVAPIAPGAPVAPVAPPVNPIDVPELSDKDEAGEINTPNIHVPKNTSAEAQPSKFYMAMAIISLILLAGSAGLSGYQYYEVFMPK